MYLPDLFKKSSLHPNLLLSFHLAESGVRFGVEEKSSHLTVPVLQQTEEPKLTLSFHFHSFGVRSYSEHQEVLMKPYEKVIVQADFIT